MQKSTSEYHILSLSGGKDSTALAFFMKENMPKIFEKLELVFCDTECELPETYEYLNKIEIFLNKKITKLKPEKSFERNYLIESHNSRKCFLYFLVNTGAFFITKQFSSLTFSPCLVKFIEPIKRFSSSIIIDFIC